MFGNRLIKSNNAGAACTTDTVQILDGTPLESIATYQLNNATTSIPNNTYPGTAYSANYAAGRFGNAYSNNGSAKYILLPRVLSTNFTWSFWVNFNSLSTCRFFGLEGGTFNPDLVIQLDGNGIRCYSGTPNGWIQLTSNPSINTWYHIVAVSGVGIYVNNTLYPASFLAQPSGSGPIGVGTDGVDIGENGYLDGLIDQVRIFDTALSAGAVTSLYNETVATASNSYINVPSCIAYYKMSDATDETGSYDGTPTNVNFNVAGKFGNAGEFNGSSSYISGLPILTNVSDSFSVSMWVNFASAPSTTEYIFGGIKEQGTEDSLIGIFVNTSGYIGANVRGSNNGTVYSATSTSSFADGNWHHVVYTLNSSILQLYIDNSQIGSDVSISSATVTVDNSVLGAINSRGTIEEYFNGKIDQVRIFNIAITANEVTTLYDEVQCIPTIVPTDYFNTVLYTGAGATNTITGVGFQPDFIWIKDRDSALNHLLADTVRGISTDSSNTTGLLLSNSTLAELTNRSEIRNLSTDGFDVTGTGSGSNTTGDDYVAWNWKAGGAAVSNTDGTITSQVSANVDAGFSIVSYTTQSGGTATVGHGLSSPPDMIIVKTTGVADSWRTYHSSLGAGFQIFLNLTNAAGATTNQWNNTAPTSSVFSLGTDNVGSYTTIAYCFHSVDGYSKIGSYVGTGASGNSIVTGFEPAFLLVKRTDSGDNWLVFDNKRNTTNPTNLALVPNSSAAEAVGNLGNGFSFLSNGFEVVSTDTGVNANGGSYIFMAFAEEVFVPTSILETNRLIDLRVENYTSGNTWNDVSGQGNNAALSSPSQPTPDSLHFNFADLGAQNKYGGNNVSIEFYIKTNNTDDDYFLTAYNGGGFIPGEMLLYIPNSAASGKPYLRVSGSTSSASQLAFDHTVVQGEWTHYVLVYDSSLTGNTNRFIMYVNGVEVTTSVIGGVDSFDNSNFMGDTSTLFIGKRGGGTDYEEMDIKAFRIYDKSLSSLEVEENYNATTALI